MTPASEARISLTVREYVQDVVKHERELAAERRVFVDEKFITIEQARIIAKDEVERARAELARQVEEARISLAQLVKEQGVTEATAEGGARTRAWFAPNGPALLSLAVAVVALVIAVLLGR